MKRCSKCGETKPVGEFYKQPDHKDGLASRCKGCSIASSLAYSAANPDRVKKQKQKWHKDWRKANPEKEAAKAKAYSASNPDYRRNYQYQYKYGITLADYDRMLEDQGNVCKICGANTPGVHTRFSIDHDHTTGKVRGLLCYKCNTSLGGFKDDPKLLRAAIEYLEA